MQDYTNQNNSSENPYASPYSVASQSVDIRAQFIRKTYTHLAGAIAAVIALEYLFLQSDMMVNLALKMTGVWWMVLIAYMGVSHIANKWAMSNTSVQKQYAGLGIYVVAQAILLLPMIYIATAYLGDHSIVMKAGGLTAAMLAGITLVAFTTKKDFSFLGGILKVGGFIAMGLIALSFIPGINLDLGMWFSAAMVLFASGSVLHSTSNIIHHYNTNQHVAASLSLFASVALLFWYVLRILMSLASSD